MNLIKIDRSRELSDKDGTYGKLYFNGVLIGYTVERPWEDNHNGTSCIPDGKYSLVVHNSMKHGDVVAFVAPDLHVYHWPSEVPSSGGRSACLIHAANYPRELQGCLSPVQSLTKDFKGKTVGGINSRITLAKLKALWGDRKDLQAEIVWT